MESDCHSESIVKVVSSARVLASYEHPQAREFSATAVRQRELAACTYR
jgi:hypothetical protein